MKRRGIAAAVIASCLIIASVSAAALFYTGILKPVNPRKELYPVRGVDVSSYQGKIDWNVIASQGISFAFVKATEGSSLVDPCFASNYGNAAAAGLRVGAYHFFSFDSPAETQADSFIKTVPKTENMLPAGHRRRALRKVPEIPAGKHRGDKKSAENSYLPADRRVRHDPDNLHHRKIDEGDT